LEDVARTESAEGDRQGATRGRARRAAQKAAAAAAFAHATERKRKEREEKERAEAERKESEAAAAAAAKAAKEEEERRKEEEAMNAALKAKLVSLPSAQSLPWVVFHFTDLLSMDDQTSTGLTWRFIAQVLNVQIYPNVRFKSVSTVLGIPKQRIGTVTFEYGVVIARRFEGGKAIPVYTFKVISSKADSIPGKAAMVLREFDSVSDNTARTFTFESQQDCDTFEAAFRHHVQRAMANPELKNMSWNDKNHKSRALWRAAGVGDVDVSGYLIGVGADLEWIEPNQQRQTPLHRAVLNGHLGTAELLLSKGAHVDPETETRWTALHVAAHKGHEDICVLLLKNNANVSAKNDQDETPLHKSVGRHS